MKKALLAVVCLTALAAQARPHEVRGSDTLGGVLRDAILSVKMETEIRYIGGGSGKGEQAMLSGEQGFAPLSREMKKDIVDKATVKGITMRAHPIGLDGVTIYVNGENETRGSDLTVIRRIYTCDITRWEEVPGSKLAGRIRAYRRADDSGTTDAFKSLVGIEMFGDCVTILEGSADVADKTSTERDSLAFAGMDAQTSENRALALARLAGEPQYLPTIDNIRSGRYPLSRTLYVYEAGGTVAPSEVERRLLDHLLRRPFLDAILLAHGFYTLD